MKNRPSGRGPLDNLKKSRMMAVLARELDLDRAMAREPGLDRRQWRSVLEEASRLFHPDSGGNLGFPGEDGTKTAPEQPSAASHQAPLNRPARPVLFTDGASRGNPGPAAAGAAVFLGQDQVGSLSRALGIKTNNQAEYQALLLGLKLVRELGFDQVSIRSDSQLMVRQIQGRYKVKDSKLKPLFDQARSALKEFSGYDIVHVERGLNRIADGLANQALDAGGG